MPVVGLATDCVHGCGLQAVDKCAQLLLLLATSDRHPAGAGAGAGAGSGYCMGVGVGVGGTGVGRRRVVARALRQGRSQSHATRLAPLALRAVRGVLPSSDTPSLPVPDGGAGCCGRLCLDRLIIAEVGLGDRVDGDLSCAPPASAPAPAPLGVLVRSRVRPHCWSAGMYLPGRGS